MNCVIPGPNLRILGKAIQALSKVGDELYFEADENQLSLRSVNHNTTVFGSIKFFIPFFTYYKIEDDSEIISSQKGVSCKMPIKALLGIFKSANQMEKQVEICKIELAKIPTKILFIFRYKHNITKTQNVWLTDGQESLQISNLTDPNLNKISASCAVYTQALANFQITNGEVSFDVTPQKIVLRNFVEGEFKNVHHVRSQLSLSPSEFSLYKIVKNTSVTFSLRPFRAAIQFAENFNLNITLTFQQASRPVEITISNNITFELNFTLATMNSEDNTQLTEILPTISTVQMSNQEQSEDPWEINSAEINQVFKDQKNKNTITIDSKLANEFNNDDFVPKSPENKKIKMHFQRCFEPTYNGSVLNEAEEIYAENSDPECEELLK